MEIFNTAIAKTISELRQTAGLSQEELGHLAEIHRTYVSQIERGLKSPTVQVLFKIAAALKIQPVDIIKSIEKHHNELQNQ
jgi:transcriptional regulator with XRE-family HTH domain